MDFSTFFHDVHGTPPLPWQARLAQHVIDRNEWPSVIDLPTASGKTACIDIALFHLVWCARNDEPWKAARRIVFVVDRRIIVDAAFERAERIRAALTNPRTKTISAVSEILGRLAGDAPLMCQKLRGGMAREQSFTLNPAQPMIITSTIDQIGSRLLFRGYGVSPYAAPVHAGLLSHDTLVLLDEAHLSGPFAATVAGILREQQRAECLLQPIRPLRLVQMSATGPSAENRFRLDDKDLTHPVIRARITATKPAKLVEASHKPAERLRVLVRETLTTLEQLCAQTPTPAVAVIVNRVGTARSLFEALKKGSSGKGFDLELVIGRSRPLDREAVADRLIRRLGPDSVDVSFEKPIVIVATQTLEVGADLDFQGLVTECAALAALRQRFGRLDRYGHFKKARAVIVGGGESKDDPVYGPALAETWTWLNTVAAPDDGGACVDFSVQAIEAALATTDIATLTVPSPPLLQFTPAFAHLLCQTTPRPVHSPDVPALLHGLRETEPDVQVVWRSDLPIRPLDGNLILDPANDEVARQLIDVNPPTSLEALSVPIGALRTWLENAETDAELADVEGQPVAGSDGKKTAPLAIRQVWRRTPEGWTRVYPREIRPGDSIVVPASYGGCDEYGFAPDSREPVRDLSSAAREEMKKSPLLTLTNWHAFNAAMPAEAPLRVVWNLISESVKEGKTDPDELPDLIREALEMLLPDQNDWLHDSLIDVCTKQKESGEIELLAAIVTSRKPYRGDISDEDLSSSRTIPVALTAHNAGVGQRARTLAQAVGLESSYVSTLGAAGDFHDIGKAEPRFQTMLRGGDRETLAGQLLAKGLRRVRGIRGESAERHEAYSVAFLKTHTELLKGAADPELALYLVGTHHGRGRALMPHRQDEGSAFVVEVNDKTYEFNGIPELGAVGSGWSSLFWRLNRRYGPWGLAYLESMLRLADQLRSAEELEGKA